MAKKDTSKVTKKSSGQVKSFSKQSKIGIYKKSDTAKSVGSGTGPKKKE